MSDIIWSNILNDRKWLDWFLAENRRRLTQAARETKQWFKNRGVPVAKANARVIRPLLLSVRHLPNLSLLPHRGNFFMLDLSEKLGIKTEAEEKEVSERLLDAGVYLVSRLLLTRGRM